jgi:tRNA(fMet)-specific endonuclease VapC
MDGNSIALDTNQAIAVLNGAGAVEQRLGGCVTVFIPAIVLGELRFGALNSARSEENLKRVEMLASRCQMLAITDVTAARYADIRLALKRSGLPIPENDIWIAASCVEHALPLATSDTHFGYVDGLTVVAM